MEIAYLSQEKYDELKKELDELKTKGRQEIAKRLKQAKELGDLSENSEYQDARQAQTNLEQQINELSELLRNAVIIKKSVGVQTARIGSRIKLEKENKEVVSYTIVGSNEASPMAGFISNESPLGRALLGRKAGETVRVETVGGEKFYKILSID